MPRPNAASLPAGGVWHADSVQDVAQSVGLGNLPDEVAQALAGDVEYRLHDIIEEALKFTRHSKRTNLTAQDIDLAMRAKNIEPLFGFMTAAPAGGSHAEYRRLKLPAGSGSNSTSVVYYLQDEEVDLQKVLATPLPPIPRDVSYTAHWLAIEGVQPAVPQNPLAHEIAAVTKKAAPASQAKANDTRSATGNIDVRPLVKHVLSRELQLYYDRVTSACLDQDEALRSAALASFRSDTGLSGLVPYLVQWAAEKVVDGALPLLGTNSSQSDTEAGFVMDCVLAAVSAMLQNKTMFVEPYLHQIMPTVLTCLLNDSLPSSLAETRAQAASLLAYILGSYATAYPSLKPRILKTLLRALIEPDRTTSTRLGAVVGLSGLGKEAIANVLAQDSNLVSLGSILKPPEGSEAGGDDSDAHNCAKRVVDALLTLQTPTKEPTAMETEEDQDKAELVEKYGPILGRELSRRPHALDGVATS